MILGSGRVGLGKKHVFLLKKMPNMQFELILKVEIEVEFGLISLNIKFNYKPKVWRGPQAAPNTLGPSNIYF